MYIFFNLRNPEKKGFFHEITDMRNLTKIFLIVLTLPAFELNAQQHAFPSAGGFGIYATGGRNGIALNDNSGNDIIRYIRIRMGKNGDEDKDVARSLTVKIIDLYKYHS